MSTQNDGGPAFPLGFEPDEDSDVDARAVGMSLRDWFAGHALAMLGDRENAKALHVANPDHPESAVARSAYALADAMLAERAK